MSEVKQLPASCAFDLCLSKLRLVDAYHAGADRFPDYDPALVSAMIQEVLASMESLRPFVQDAVVDSSGSCPV